MRPHAVVPDDENAVRERDLRRGKRNAIRLRIKRFFHIFEHLGQLGRAKQLLGNGRSDLPEDRVAVLNYLFHALTIANEMRYSTSSMGGLLPMAEIQCGVLGPSSSLDTIGSNLKQVLVQNTVLLPEGLGINRDLDKGRERLQARGKLCVRPLSFGQVK